MVRLSLMTLALLACTSRTPTVESPTEPRLIQQNGQLHVVRAPGGLTRGMRLYALAAQPIPGAKTHPAIGVLRVVQRQGDLLKVTWACPPSHPPDLTEGLPIRLLAEDQEIRLGTCWTQYKVHDPEAWAKADRPKVVSLALGKVDGVKEGDQYTLLGDPLSATAGGVVDAVEVLGTCTILVYQIDEMRSLCQLDKGLPSMFTHQTLQTWSRGYAQRIRVEP